MARGKVKKYHKRSRKTSGKSKKTVEVKRKRIAIKKIESEVLKNPDIINNIPVVYQERTRHSKDTIEQIMFDLPHVEDPLIGTPKQVQKILDSMAKKMQRDPNNNGIFDKIHLYMHGYLINVVLKKFPFIKGFQTSDIYQETLIALRFKAIPNFKRNKGMSFLNFAKMCIRRHLITLLNTSKNRKRDQSINQAVSLESSPLRNDDNNDGEEKTTFSNIISDKKPIVSEEVERNEAYQITKGTLMGSLSDFERVVLREYLESSSYDEISDNISGALSKKCNTKSIDNALLRIRKKAIHLKRYSKLEEIPIFITK
jgi:RNA polymerase sporulation-specific sigma factor